MRQRDRTPTGVAIWIPIEANRLDRAGRRQSRFFFQLAQSACSDGFVDFEKPTRKSPSTCERFVLATDKKDANRAFEQGEDSHIDRDLRTGMVVAIAGWHEPEAFGTMARTTLWRIFPVEVTMSKRPVELPPWTEPDPQDDEITSLVSTLSREDGPADLASRWWEPLWSALQDAGA